MGKQPKPTSASPRFSPRLAAAAASAVPDMSLDNPDKAARKAAKKAAKAAEAAKAAGAAAAASPGADADEAARAARKAARKAAKRAAEPVADAPAGPAAKKAKPAGESSGASPGPSFATFAEAPFDKRVVAALSAAYPSPSPIQQRAWPLALAFDHDLIAVAKTGSGKTLAFVLPVLHKLGLAGAQGGGKSGPPAPRALIMSPTRELALQILGEAVRFGALVGISCAACYGGTPVQAQKAELASKRPAVLVATPGRLVDMLEHKSIALGSCESVVLDEADRLLDMGFEPQLKAVFGATPASRQTLLFTATWPKAVRKLAASYLRDEAHTSSLFLSGGVDDEGAADGSACELSANRAVTQSFVHATDDLKEKKLYDIISVLTETDRVIVFANTKRRCESLSTTFWSAGFGTCAIHGDKKQDEREKALADFIACKCPLMFATDVAARGLDITGVTHVVNFDMARDVESYVHRIGRTGRAGATGASITFWNPDYDKECAPGLVKIAKDAGQPVPDWLAKFSSAKSAKLWDVAKAAAALKAAAATGA